MTTVGIATAPAQPYLGNPNPSDWIGGYAVDGEQVFSVRYALLAPDNDEPAGATTDLTTKWGTALSAGTSRQISYLLWRYGATTDAVEAAALAHLLHSWTSAPTNPGQLDPANDAVHIAYDAPFHHAKLPTAHQAIADLETEAAAYADQWAPTLISPPDAQVGVAGTWTFGIRTVTTDTPVPNFPARVEVVGGTLPGGVTSLDIVTAADGSPFDFDVTPSADDVTVTVFYDQIAATAQMVPAVDPSTASWVVRSDNFSEESTAISLTAQPAAPELAATGPGSWLPGVLAAALLVTAGILLSVRRRTGRATSAPAGLSS